VELGTTLIPSSWARLAALVEVPYDADASPQEYVLDDENTGYAF
jgi:hypothetical protein